MLQDVYSRQRRTLSQAELNAVLGQHEHYVACQGGMRAMLGSTNLEGLSLANRNLSEADLSGASLVGANLYGSNLTRASLYCADLRNADLRNANIAGADLRGVSFRGANLGYAVLNEADMRAATMMYVGEKFKMQGNAHEFAPFGSVDFSNCSLRNATFGNARLENANFSNALLQGTRFRGAKLANACFAGAILTGVDLADLDVPPESLKGCIISPMPAAEERAKVLLQALRAHHEWVVSGGKKGRTAKVDHEDLRPLGDALKGLCLTGLSARGAIAISVDFEDCQLQAARFDDADLRGANFTGADLCGATFDRANVAHADFSRAKISDLILRNGDVLVASADNARGVADQFATAEVQTSSFTSKLAS